MATVNLDLYVLWQRGRFVTSLSNPAVPVLPAITGGDTWDLRVFYVDDTNPLQLHRFAGVTTEVRFRASGNNHVYASAFQSSEIIPPPASVTRLQAGSATQIEIQKVTFGDPNSTGTFTIRFIKPSQTAVVSGGLDHVHAAGGTSAPIPFNATAAEIEAALNAISFFRFRSNDGGGQVGDAISIAGTPSAAFTVVNRDAASFEIHFGSLKAQGGNQFNTQVFNVGSPSVALLILNESNVQSAGWNVSVPLTDADFSDLFIAGNGPAYLEVLLNGNLAGAKQLTAAPGGGNAPAFTNGPAPGSSTVDTFYDFTYAAGGFPAPTFALTSGTLPPGLALAAGGRLSGTPASNGTYSGIVTASNGVAPDATQAFSIHIGSGVNPGPGGVSPLASYRNGNFNVLEPSDGIWYEQYDEWPGLVLWHIPYVLDLDTYNAIGVPALGSYEAPFGHFYRDTPWRYIGDGIIQFERLRHNLPGDANRVVSVTKNYQAGLYTFADGGISAMAILSFARPIKANCNYHYALGDPGGLPIIPVAMIVPWLNGQAATDLGTGFPHAAFNPPSGGSFNLPDNNYAASNLEGSSIAHIFGDLFCRKLYTG